MRRYVTPLLVRLVCQRDYNTRTLNTMWSLTRHLIVGTKYVKAPIASIQYMLTSVYPRTHQLETLGYRDVTDAPLLSAVPAQSQYEGPQLYALTDHASVNSGHEVC